jgi:putative transposase
MLREASEQHRAAIHGYVLMKTHFHLLATPETPTAVEKTMHVLGLRYVRYFNRRYARTGTLFEDRYKSPIVDDERYWITCLRYIELNPVRAGIVASPADYRWSSYRAHAFGTTDPLITQHQRYRDLGATPSARQNVWQNLCAADLSAEELNRIRFAAFEERVLRSREPTLIGG